MTEATYQAVKDTAESMPKGRRFSVRGVLNKIGVSASGYYDWLKREPSEQERRKQRIKELIKKIHADSHFIYGAPKITQILRGMGEKISERTVSIYMKELGIRACWVKPYTVTTISKDFSDNLKNVLKREFDPNEPNAVWCTDITYLWTDEGFLYLSCIMDLFSRRVYLSGEDVTSVAGTTMRDRVCTLELWAECFSKDPASMRKTDSYELNGIMRKIEGWKKYEGNKSGRVRFPIYGPQYAYERCDKS